MMNQRQPVATSTFYHHHQQHQHQPNLHHHHQHLPLPPAAGTPYHDVAYHRHHHHHHQQQQPPQYADLAVVAGPGPYQHPSFRSQHHSHATALSHRTRAQERARQQQQQQRSMSQSQHFSGEEELAELQKLSNEYEPEAKGPLVGSRQPSTALTTEYASADPVYQAKTAALPQKYSHYRTVRGDGNCGWRAVAYGYFEALIHHGDSNSFAIEEARLRSMQNIIQQAGFDPMLIEDFADEAYDLLRYIAADALGLPNVDALLLEKFNDEMLQNYIITYLKTLTAAWMKTHEEIYAPWLIGQTVTQFCDNQVLPVAAEIDHVGLMALKDVLLSPAGMSLEVLYLDRSEGSEVTMHRFDPVDNGGFTIGRVRLLYRPGHYDILYKMEDLPTPPPAPVPTYLQFATQNHEQIYDLGNSDFMAAIPGMSYANPNLSSTGWMSSTFGNSGGADLFAPAPIQTCTQAVPPPSAAPAPHPQVQIQQPVPVSAYPTPAPTHTHELAIRTQTQHSQISGGPFRPSIWQFDSDFMQMQAASQMPFQTSIFRNSHFNTAHFLNPEFQPEQWDPEDEYATGSTATRRLKTNG